MKRILAGMAVGVPIALWYFQQPPPRNPETASDPAGPATAPSEENADRDGVRKLREIPLEQARRHVETEPESPEARFRYAWLLEKSGRAREAKAQKEEGRKLRAKRRGSRLSPETPDDSPAPDAFALVAEEREYHRRRVEQSPDSAEVHLDYAPVFSSPRGSTRRRNGKSRRL